MTSVHVDKKWFLPQVSKSFPSTYKALKSLSPSNWPKKKKTMSANEFAEMLKSIGAEDLDDAIEELGDPDNDEFGDYDEDEDKAAFFLLGLCGLGEFKSRDAFGALSDALNPATSTKNARVGKATRTISAGVAKLGDKSKLAKAGKKLKKGKKKKRKKKKKRLTRDDADERGEIPSSEESSSSSDEEEEEEGIDILGDDDLIVSIDDDDNLIAPTSNSVARVKVEESVGKTQNVADDLIMLETMASTLSEMDTSEIPQEDEDELDLVKTVTSTSPRRKKEEESKRLKAEQEFKFESQASELEDDLEASNLLNDDDDGDELMKGNLSVSKLEQSKRVREMSIDIPGQSLVDDNLSPLLDNDMSVASGDEVLTPDSETIDRTIKSSRFERLEIDTKKVLKEDDGNIGVLDDDDCNVSTADDTVLVGSKSPRSRRDSLSEIKRSKVEVESQVENIDDNMRLNIDTPAEEGPSPTSELISPSVSPRRKSLVERKVLESKEDHEAPKVCEESIGWLNEDEDSKVAADESKEKFVIENITASRRNSASAVSKMKIDYSFKKQRPRYGTRGLGECDKKEFLGSKRRAYCGLFFDVL